MIEWVLYESEKLSIANAYKQPEDLWNLHFFLKKKTVFKVLFYNKHFWFKIYCLYALRNVTYFMISSNNYIKNCFFC